MLLSLFVPLVLTGSALAQEAVTLKLVKTGQVGTSLPSITFDLHQDASQLDIHFTCGTRKFDRSGKATLGEAITFPLDLPAGTHTCKGALSGSFSDGTEGEMPLSFGVTMFPPLGVKLQEGSLDLKKRELLVVLDRKAGKVEVTAAGLGGTVLGMGEVTSGAGPGSPIKVTWTAPGGGASEGEVLKIHVRAFDAEGYWSELELSPWSYAIPHEDVVFATNMSDIEPGEVPKLTRALGEVRRTQEKYGSDVVIKLYVGGYTDTMGDPAANQKLSVARALSIARWFKDNGFVGEVYYQGFGESGLLVQTGDSVDEPRNRRVEYLLAAQPPPSAKGWVGL